MNRYNGGFIGAKKTFNRFPKLIGGKVQAWVGITSQTTINLSTVSNDIIKDDLVIVMYAVASTADVALTIDSAGYTNIVTDQYINGTYDTNYILQYKFMTETPDTTVVFSSTGNAAYPGGAAIFIVRGANRKQPFDVNITTSSSTSLSTVTTPSITPVTKNSMIIVFAASAFSGSVTGYTDGGTLSNFMTTGALDTTDILVGLGTYYWTSGAYTTTITSSGGGGSYFATAVAIRPENEGIWDNSSPYDTRFK